MVQIKTRRIERCGPISYDLLKLIHKWAFPMVFKNIFLVGSCVSVVVLSACGTTPRVLPDMEDAKFWQRSSASSALYLQGPKAQQMLHQDISVCVREISELERLGEIRRAVPANYNSGNEIETRSASQKKLDRYDTPERDGYLYSEHLEYHDFETCMNAKGWERVDFLPYEEADKARMNYLDRIKSKMKRSGADRENVTTLHTTSQNPPPYGNLNQ